ncbi:hypothetical protein LTR28_005754 [Elasticomyces elasticus]|nr:hypothetical protein LTR28_005754 [Elasticomyces elasticus]
MPEIFRNAKEVLVWLGQHERQSEMVMDILTWTETWVARQAVIEILESEENDVTLDRSDLSSTQRRYSLELQSQAIELAQRHDFDATALDPFGQLVLESYRLERYDGHIEARRKELHERARATNAIFPGSHPFWKSFVAFNARPWYSRAWTHQEVMLARRATVLCGANFANWHILQICRESVLDELQSLCPESMAEICPNELHAIFRSPRHFLPLLDEIMTLRLLLLGTGWREATVPSDFIYSLLGLVSDHVRAQIPVDYTLPTALIYRLAVQVACKGEDGLCAWLKLIDVYQAFATDNLTGLPSWCPDFSDKHSVPIEADFVGSAQIEKELLPESIANVKYLKLVIDDDSLFVPGAVIDTVNRTSRLVSTQFREKSIPISDERHISEGFHLDAMRWLLSICELFTSSRPQDSVQLELWLQEYSLGEQLYPTSEELALRFEAVRLFCETVVHQKDQEGDNTVSIRARSRVHPHDIRVLRRSQSLEDVINCVRLTSVHALRNLPYHPHI